MNKTISVIRIAILFILSGLAFIFIFGEEQDENVWAFFFHVIVDKGLALAAFWYGGKLYKRWSKIDPWLKAYDKKCDEVMKAPNPCCIED